MLSPNAIYLVKTLWLLTASFGFKSCMESMHEVDFSGHTLDLEGIVTFYNSFLSNFLS